ncbi:laminin subunit alpha-5 isoform X2 [Oryzias melastigma]|uniref:laminin subunit alpha-5 isoform X2 n=1 Tax=Oryzias melastigma TaxID=30732 RepID=UPI00168D6749|nr:laminin subunit alpha-5 isoform X2 [Oryzias melastigma]
MARGAAALSRLLWPLLVTCGCISAQELPANGLNGYSLHPPYFNLAEGTKITATATCGLDDAGRSIQDLYCKLVGGPVSGDPSQTIQGQYCDICSQGLSDRAHPITNAIDGTERWWQSPPLSRNTEYNEVNVTLDLGQLFHVAYVLIKFANSPRPDLWVLERSTDFGQTYQPWQYFASSKRDCIERFGQRTIERINSDDDVICTTEYSRIVPLENGEIVVSLVNGRPGAMNFSYSPVLRDFTKATNIRLRFLRTNTLLGHLMGKALRDPTVTRRYYYSIKDISIGGRCVCNGHADACDAKDPNDPYKLQCDCQHHTCGVSCDQCCPGYNQLPWKPATTYSANECEPCNCHHHSFECYYDPEIDLKRLSLDIHGHHRGGGVCLNCQHHTTGVNCERCIPTYYRSPDHPIQSPQACSPCNCQLEFNDGTCEDLTGRCFCKPNYTGDECDACASGFTGFPECYPVPTFPTNGEAKPAGEIINCECSAAGTVDNSCRPDPRTRTCICKPGFTGEHCDTCAPGFYGLNCQACQCLGPGCYDGSCDLDSGDGVCRNGFQGSQCDQCAPGYFNYPLCQLCGCSTVGSLPEGCDDSGRCLCRPEFQGPRCEQCRSGFHSFPNCQECVCDPRTSLDSSCTVSGICHCRPNYSGASCDQCAPGYHGYPSCTPCHCSSDGSRHVACEQTTGQCACLPGVVGLRCDACAHGSYGFPNCQAGTCHPAGSVPVAALAHVGQCECRPHVEGPACDRCKPLYWNLSPDSPFGCSSCECNTAGTLSGVAECAQESGQCPCKPSVCSGTCSACKDGYYNLQHQHYFGCQSCQCDVGGSLGPFCEDQNGQCRCRSNVEGPKCDVPRPDHYFPDLHHLKFEIEEGTMMDGRPVRFGYNLLEFPNFSWRGYAEMSFIQPAVKLQVYVSEADLFLTRFIISYVNSEGATSNGRIRAYQANRRGSEQSKPIVFAPSVEPTFVNVPQNSFVEPFVLNPGTWTVVIEAEGVLLDYLVLLPSAYYEAPLLQMRVTEPCVYSSTPEASKNCLLYKYLSLDAFPSVSCKDASCRNDNHLPRPCPVERVTPRHPDMAVCSGNDISVGLRVRRLPPGEYNLLLEYSSEEEEPQTLSVSVNTPGPRTRQHRLTLLQCKYSFLCRAVATDEQRRVSVFSLPADAEIQLSSDRASFFLHQVYLIPADRFTMEYAEPKVHCINTHGRFSPDSSSCIPSRFQKPSDSLDLREGQSSTLQAEQPSEAEPAAAPPTFQSQEPAWMDGVRPPFGVDDNSHMRLDAAQNMAVYSSRVPALGRYVFMLHYHQPLHPTYQVQAFINGGRIWQGHTNASFCPHAYGCRNVLVSENQIILDVTDHDVFITVQIPADRTLWLDYILVVPEASYSSSHLTELPLDQSYSFISTCGLNSFYIDSYTASPFCLRSAVSLSAFFNNGAMPCACHEVGALSDTCQQFGGQCRCRPNVIGRDCSMCATGFWGFPNCRPCNCGSRLCEPVNGECICPPRTLLPECSQCEPQTFGCHPIVGCEVCNCSHGGVLSHDDGCDSSSGQCSCKSNIIGRQCDRCTPGYYGYPNCRPCECNEAGTEEEVCDSITGRCLCKENVQGARCDQCRIGTFHLDPTNPKGCTSCFCFGATDRCRSSDKRRTEVIDMKGWVLLGADRQEVVVNEYPDQDLVEADLSDVPDVYQDLYWHAPNTYLGDKVSSYGGLLSYRLHTQTMRGDSLSLPPEASRPDVILKGNQMTLVFMHREYSAPEAPHEGKVRIIEGSFRHSRTGNSVSREELMMVLVRLESLQIRALHSQSAHSVSLRGVVLEAAESVPNGLHANNVEICVCPANYRGDSCQKCAPGYYRDTIGLFMGKCVPCNCNGHSDQCLDGSGVCLNCQHNTAGNQCEKCRGGFLGNNSLDGQAVACSSCPCPLRAPSNNFAERCVQGSRSPQCLCMPGYAGPRCERCAPGFYGNPMVLGSSCQPCDCNGNSDPNMLFVDCHSQTGKCLSCMHNTAGDRCHLCAPGFYGDAVGAKNCTKCDCSPCGTKSCDPHSGQCHCKPGVTGARCERCEDGTFGFDSCSGCSQCDCDASAALVQPCNPQSGQCACRPGVNGPNCRQCAPGFWDYGANGCKKCDCRGHCDPRTGECHCPDGMTGKQCDRCIHKDSVPVEDQHGIHCQKCDSCVLVLLEDLDHLEQNLTSAEDQLQSLNASSMAWAQLDNLNRTIEDAARSMQSFNSTLEAGRSQADVLQGDVSSLEGDIDELQRKVEGMTGRVGELHNRTSNTHQQAEDLLSFVSNISMEINEILLMANRSLNETDADQDSEDRETKMREVQAMLRVMRDRSCVGQRKQADKEKAEAEKLLDRVIQELANRQDQNKNLSKSIRDHLSRLHSDMMELRDSLNEAVNDTARAAELNNINQQTLEDVHRKAEQLLDQQNQLKDQLSMAVDNVAQVNDIPPMLGELKEEYERLAAQLDGARLPLAQKVQNITLSNSKIPLVEEAEKHAELLNALAMNLSSVITKTKEDGITDVTKIYNNIVNRVKEAEEAAEAALKEANSTLESINKLNLSESAKSLSNRSTELNEEALKLRDNLNYTLKPQLEDARRKLESFKAKQAEMMKDLEAAQKNLSSTTNLTQEIEEVKRVAGLANSTATKLNNELQPIKKQLDEWQQAYGNTNTTSEEINNALMDANNTVQKLDETIPTLLRKLDELQNHSAQMPNISESISRIRQLIQEARNAASKITVPMKFNGSSGVLVRNPSNLADLAAYTSLKLYISLTAPTRRRRAEAPSQFVFYLGNKDSSKEFLGMTLEGKRLRWHFNVGGETADVLMTEDLGADGQFKAVVMERILQHGRMSMTYTDKKVQKTTKVEVEAKGDEGLLNLLTNDTVFYVGGYPDTFKPPPPLNVSSNFKGCIELDTLNEEVLSLYNFEETFALNTTSEKPCVRSKTEKTDQWENDGVYFDGTGFAEVKVQSDWLKGDRIEQEVKVVSRNGILLLLQNGTQFFCLAVVQGKLKLFYDFDGELKEPASVNSGYLPVSDADKKTIEVILLDKEFVVRNNPITVYREKVSYPQFESTYYLGGVPENMMPESLKDKFPKQGSIKACFRNVKAKGSHIDLKRMKTSGLSFSCDSDLLVAREAYFGGQSYLEQASLGTPCLRNDFYASFGFRTAQADGLMFFHEDQVGTLKTFLKGGHVVVNDTKTSIRTQKTYNDDNSHYIAIYNNAKGMRILMDDVLEPGSVGKGDASEKGTTVSSSSTFLGGKPDQNLRNLTGCLSNVFIKRENVEQKVLDLLKVKENFNVPFECPASKTPQQIVAAPQRVSKRMKGRQRKLSGSFQQSSSESCQQLQTLPESGATHFSGSAHSYQRYESGSILHHFSMELKINSSDGLVLLADGRRHSGAVLTLSVSKGHLVLLVDGPSGRDSLRPKKKYNDNQWHTVFVKHEGQKISLVVDGINARSMRLPGTRVTGPLYVGGAPRSVKDLDSPGFAGCVRDLRLNNAHIGKPAYSQGTLPCFQNLLQPGVYFSGGGGHVKIDESLVLDRDVEIQLEVRPVSDSGLLLHAETSTDLQLSVILAEGKVTVSVNNGERKFSTSVTPLAPLCDGRWHTVTVIKQNKSLRLQVDGASTHRVGPKQSRSAGAKAALYLGGVQGGAKAPRLPDGLPAFTGCVRRVTVNHRAVTLSKPLSVHGTVGTRGCPPM